MNLSSDVPVLLALHPIDGDINDLRFHIAHAVPITNQIGEALQGLLEGIWRREGRRVSHQRNLYQREDMPVDGQRIPPVEPPLRPAPAELVAIRSDAVDERRQWLAGLRRVASTKVFPEAQRRNKAIGVHASKVSKIDILDEQHIVNEEKDLIHLARPQCTQQVFTEPRLTRHTHRMPLEQR